MSKVIDFRKMMSRAPRVRLGDYIEQTDERNSTGIYTSQDVRGISTGKSFIDTKANLDGVSLVSYKIVKPNDFAYVADTSRRGDKIALAINHSSKSFIISSIYTTFRSKNNNQLDPAFLYIILSRVEFDRYTRFNSWGSARETFDWGEMQRVIIPLPSIDVQREIVAIYEGLKKIAEENEALLDPLQNACHAYIVDCKAKYPLHTVGEYVRFIKEKNSDLEITLEQGVNIQKEFITPQRVNSDLSSRLKVRTGQIVYCTQLNNENVAIAHRTGPDCVVSPVYRVMEVVSPNELIPEYLFLNLQRKEFGRFVYWAAVGSAYEFLLDENMQRYEIPLPPIDVQKAIVSIYHCMEEAKSIAREARELMKTICPALIQKAANSI